MDKWEINGLVAKTAQGRLSGKDLPTPPPMVSVCLLFVEKFQSARPPVSLKTVVYELRIRTCEDGERNTPCAGKLVTI